jgi:hypothetical protein
VSCPLDKNILWIGHCEADLKGMEVVVVLYPWVNLPAYLWLIGWEIIVLVHYHNRSEGIYISSL